ncbi:hypothetical protein [Paenibacillus sp. A14]|uniref:hypothetical protein n=1 Tax=Paenibacillus sp. A14 TaxID=3119820 RepID=UPI002FE2DE2E
MFNQDIESIRLIGSSYRRKKRNAKPFGSAFLLFVYWHIRARFIVPFSLAPQCSKAKVCEGMANLGYDAYAAALKLLIS